MPSRARPDSEKVSCLPNRSCISAIAGGGASARSVLLIANLLALTTGWCVGNVARVERASQELRGRTQGNSGRREGSEQKGRTRPFHPRTRLDRERDTKPRRAP